jgi:hypothetical protein
MEHRVPDGSCGAMLFRPNGRGYRAVRDVALTLSIVSGIAACAGYQPSTLWILATLLLLMIGCALVSVKLIVGPDRVSFGILGMTTDFPATKIERDRFDELAFMNFFQLSLSDGPFVLIPHAAFVDSTAFDAIIALAEKHEAKRDCGAEKVEISRDNR